MYLLGRVGGGGRRKCIWGVQGTEVGGGEIFTKFPKYGPSPEYQPHRH